jgi:putative glutathione S-transferase
MGRLVDGLWTTGGLITKRPDGRFVRPRSGFRNWVPPDGSPGPSGEGGFPAEAGRYHLYVSYACPWAHRTIIFRVLKGLEPAIGLSVVSPKMPDERGWNFVLGDSTGDPINGAEDLADIYRIADPHFTGRVTVPVLWDKTWRTIVNNESSEIIRMLNSAFDEFTAERADYYPAPLRERVDAINARVYDDINNGVYKAGFAITQEAYEDAAEAVFAALDWVEGLLGDGEYLCGDTLTEADWRLFTTLVRFDAVYYSHFKCNRRQIAEYPNLSRYLKGLYNTPGVADTVRLDHIKTHYYWSQTAINPTQIVPIGPTPAFMR